MNGLNVGFSIAFMNWLWASGRAHRFNLCSTHVQRARAFWVAEPIHTGLFNIKRRLSRIGPMFKFILLISTIYFHLFGISEIISSEYGFMCRYICLNFTRYIIKQCDFLSHFARTQFRWQREINELTSSKLKCPSVWKKIERKREKERKKNMRALVKSNGEQQKSYWTKRWFAFIEYST